MDKISKFEKVSLERFKMDALILKEKYDFDLNDAYSLLAMPKRATKGSAGYDLFCPFGFELKPEQSIIIPTGLRCRMAEGWVMLIFPKSGLGFKYRLQLDNTVGVVDSDYYDAENEGHILVRLTNDNKEGKELSIPGGKAFAQALFLPFGITEDDEVSEKRIGGFGSTNA